MKFLDSFKKLFSKKEPEIIRVEKVKKVIGRNLSAKIKADIKKEKELPRFATDAETGFIDEEEKEKIARKLIDVKRKERLQKEKAAKQSAKKKLARLTSNF